MIWVIIVLALLVAVLCVALYFQVKGSHDQAGEQEALLRDYQRRVDEQQQLLEDYRSLQKNFDNVGEGYEQALELYDKMEENSRKLEERNKFLEDQNKELQTANNAHSEELRQHQEFFTQLIQDLEKAVENLDPAVSGPVAGYVYKMQDATELGSDAPIERNDNIVAEQVAKRAIAESAIDQCQYFTFQLTVTPQAVDADLQASQVSYTVADTGMGVPAAEAEHIFEPNVKLNSYFDGQGLGLTFARSIARRLGGDLVLDTTNTEKGARFVLTLPM